jgi:osmotically-inducible protein OsmY
MLKTSALLLLVAGCAHQAGTTASTEDELGRAYESVVSGAKDTARAGGYLIEKAGDSGVRVVREAPIGGLARDVTDTWITAKVKGKLATDKDVKSSKMHVHTDAGLVTLEGTVESRGEALKAVRDALETDGVTAVNSELEFPTQMRAKISPESTKF